MIRSPGPQSHRTPRRRCAYCNQPFVAYRNSVQKYCSQECARRSNARYSLKAFEYDRRNPLAERDFAKAQRAEPQSLQPRLYQDGSRRYVAISADALLESLSAADQARPGHPCG